MAGTFPWRRSRFRKTDLNGPIRVRSFLRISASHWHRAGKRSAPGGWRLFPNELVLARRDVGRPPFTRYHGLRTLDDLAACGRRSDIRLVNGTSESGRGDRRYRADDLDGRHGRGGWHPIRYDGRSAPEHLLGFSHAGLYAAADDPDAPGGSPLRLPLLHNGLLCPAREYVGGAAIGKRAGRVLAVGAGPRNPGGAGVVLGAIYPDLRLRHWGRGEFFGLGAAIPLSQRGASGALLLCL